MTSDAPQSHSFCSQGTLLDSFFDGAYLRSVEYLLAAVTTIVAVNPILQNRATIYLWSDVSMLAWREILANSGYAEESSDLSRFVFHREQDKRRVKIEILKDLKATYFATHEICFMTARASYSPFYKLSLEKCTLVYGSLHEKWQVEELKALHSLGWTVHSVWDGQPGPSSGLLRTAAAGLEGRSHLLSDDTKVVVHHTSESDGFLVRNIEIKAVLGEGIQVAMDVSDELYD